MGDTKKPKVKYLECHCPFIKQEVWAILIEHPNDVWKIANCLDKNTECFQHACVFTTDGGEWPFEENQIQDRILS